MQEKRKVDRIMGRANNSLVLICPSLHYEKNFSAVPVLGMFFLIDVMKFVGSCISSSLIFMMKVMV
jgi:hypothetical protein